jgi:hypothetical protein
VQAQAGVAEADEATFAQPPLKPRDFAIQSI